MNKYIVQLIMLVWGQASPGLREAIIASVKQWEAKAKATKGVGDDILVGVVKFLLGIP